MEFREYLEQAKNYIDGPEDLGPYYTILGLNESCGKLSGKLRSFLAENKNQFTPKDRNKIAFSVGDVLLSCAAIVDSLGMSFEDVISLSFAKYDKMKKENIK